MVGQGRQDEIRRLQHRGQDATCGDRQFGLAHAPDQDGGEQIAADLHQVRQQILGQTYADRIVIDPRLQQPAAGLWIGHRLGQQLTQEHDLYPAIAHGIDEGHVLDPRLLDPDHVVEEQLRAVGRCQPRHGGAGFVNEDAAQFARFGLDAVGQGFVGCHVGVPPRSTPRLRTAMMMIVRPSRTGQTKRSQRS